MNKPKILLYGDETRIYEFLKVAINHDYKLEVSFENLNDNLQKNINEASTFCNNFQYLETFNYQELNLLIYLPEFEIIENESNSDIITKVNNMLPEFRGFLNKSISNGFNGKILIDSQYDSIIAYFAARFSGFDAKNIIGIGSQVQNEILSNYIANQFNVDNSLINITTLGYIDDYTISWSRSYIGSMPLLSYLNDKSNDDRNDLLNDAQSVIYQISEDNQLIHNKVIFDVIFSLFSKKSKLMFVTTLDKNNDKIQLNFNPVLINQNGYNFSFELQVSDNEKEELEGIIEHCKLIINNIIENRESSNG